MSTMIAAAISPPGPLSSVIVRYCQYYLARKTGVRPTTALRQQQGRQDRTPTGLSTVASCEGGCRAAASLRLVRRSLVRRWIAASCECNNDGTDDMAWCNSETNLTGCWQITNKTLASWQNIATIA